MSKPTKKQKEFLEIIREELRFMKEDCNNINTLEIPEEIDRVTKKLMDGTMEPKIEPRHADRLNDILYEIVTLTRDLER